MARSTPFENAAVAGVFESWPPAIRGRLLALRELIFETASATDGVGTIEETLRWGEPAYLTPHSKSGSTVRIGWKKAEPSRYAMYFNCQTDLIETFATLAIVWASFMPVSDSEKERANEVHSELMGRFIIRWSLALG